MALNKWEEFISEEKNKEYFKNIGLMLKNRKNEGKIIYPPQEEIFSAFKFTSFDDVKVVILGQDPYHGPGQAHGFSFSVKPGIKIPPSLANIYKELVDDIPGFKYPNHGCLIPWAKQGVLLMNAVMTVEQKDPNSHAGKGWETFTDNAIKKINDEKEGVIFLLWGSYAQKKGANIDKNRHIVLEAAHPSPFSAYRGFLGCKHFSKVNEELIRQNKDIINWQI